MAERRMFAKTIVLMDEFLDMPLSARCLYFTLGMFADDDGFIDSPKSIMRQCGASQDDMRILLQKKFVICFDTGVIVITHWRINNYLRIDRYRETEYTEEKSKLILNDDGSYEKTDERYTNGIPMVYQPSTSCLPDGIPTVNEPSTDNTINTLNTESDHIYINNNNNSMDCLKGLKDRMGYGEGKRNRFKKPTIEEVIAYCQERGNSVDPQQFVDFYESKGWKVGNQSMKDWKAAVRTWEKRDRTKDKPKPKPNRFNNFEQRSYDFDELERKLLGR